jgi:hypothetical protein
MRQGHSQRKVDKAEFYREQNIEAARIILDNVHHYGGEESMVRWARLVLVGSQPIRRAA